MRKQGVGAFPLQILPTISSLRKPERQEMIYHLCVHGLQHTSTLAYTGPEVAADLPNPLVPQPSSVKQRDLLFFQAWLSKRQNRLTPTLTRLRIHR